jgi:hypothetical protein
MFSMYTSLTDWMRRAIGVGEMTWALRASHRGKEFWATLVAEVEKGELPRGIRPVRAAL